MLDIKFVRENPEVVKQNISNKFQDKQTGTGRQGYRTGQRKP